MIKSIKINKAYEKDYFPDTLVFYINLPFYFIGIKFAGLEKVLKNVEYIGYYTDRDLSKKSEAAQFVDEIKKILRM